MSMFKGFKGIVVAGRRDRRARTVRCRGSAQSSLPAFPGAQGYGSKTRHAYAGSPTPTVYRVTNLNDSGSGSLRAALTAGEPRVVICEVSGYVSLSGPIDIKSPYLYFAGETCPSPGLTVRNDWIYVNATHDVVLRHIRVRSTNLGGSSPLSSRGGLGIIFGSYNVVIDHCSVSWHTDDGLQAYGAGTRDSTYSNCIVSEGLYVDYENSGSAGLVAVGGSGVLERVSYIRNLSAHTARRNGVLQTQNTTTAYVNNLHYNWADRYSTSYIGTTNNGPAAPVYSAVVGNKYVQGANADLAQGDNYGILFWGDYRAGKDILTAASRLYVADISVVGSKVIPYKNLGTFDPLINTPPAQLQGILSQISVLPSSEVEAYVLANAGARPADRDSHDARIVNEVKTRTGRLKGYTQWGEGSPGAWPSLATSFNALTLPQNPHAVTSSGYTNLEIWLHSFAVQAQGGTSSPSAVPSAPVGVRISG